MNDEYSLRFRLIKTCLSLWIFYPHSKIFKYKYFNRIIGIITGETQDRFTIEFEFLSTLAGNNQGNE